MKEITEKKPDYHGKSCDEKRPQTRQNTGVMKSAGKNPENTSEKIMRPQIGDRNKPGRTKLSRSPARSEICTKFRGREMPTFRQPRQKPSGSFVIHGTPLPNRVFGFIKRREGGQGCRFTDEFLSRYLEARVDSDLYLSEYDSN